MAAERACRGVAVLALAGMLALPGAAAAQELLLSRGQWPQPATGDAVVRLPALRAVLERYEREPGARIIIRHPGGDAGSAWGREVHGWLVALGVPSADIALEPPSGMPDTLILDTASGEASTQ